MSWQDISTAPIRKPSNARIGAWGALIGALGVAMANQFGGLATTPDWRLYWMAYGAALAIATFGDRQPLPQPPVRKEEL